MGTCTCQNLTEKTLGVLLCDPFQDLSCASTAKEKNSILSIEKI